MKHCLTLVSLLVLALAQACSPRSSYYDITGSAQGGRYVVRVNLAPDGNAAALSPEAVKVGIDSILTAVDNSVSGYNPQSLLSRFNAGENVVLDGIFRDILERSVEYFHLTEGALDVAAGPLFNIWGFGFTDDEMPSAEKVDSVRANCGMALALAGGPAVYNFNAVAQGYSCDLVASYLRSLGVKDMLINVGGEMFCDGLNQNGCPWSIGIDRPTDGNNASGKDIQAVFHTSGGPCGVVTSGNYRKFYVRDGRKYSHTVDPRTGYPVTHNLLSATIIAPNAADADAFATCCMVIGLEKAREFVLSHEGIEACLVYDDAGGMSVWTSPGFELD